MESQKHLAIGIHDNVPMADYVNDKLCAEPTARKTGLHLSLFQSPAHARLNSPRLSGAAREDKRTPESDMGTAIHSGILGGEEVVCIDAKTYQGGAAKKARQEAYDAGKTPILATHWDSYLRAVEEGRKNLAALCATLGDDGKGECEQTMVWRHDGVLCAGRPDWISTTRRVVIDLKTNACAEPVSWSKRSLWAGKYDMGVAHVLSGVRALFGVPARFYFLVQETSGAYDHSVVEMSDEGYAFAEEKHAQAIEIWRKCLWSGEWPGYSRGVYVAELPPWLAREYDEMMEGAA